MLKLYLITVVAILSSAVKFCEGYNHGSQHEDCRDRIIHQFRQACISFKRSANFFQPQSKRSVSGFEEVSEEDTIDAASLLMGHLSPRLPRNSEGHSIEIEGSTHSTGNVLTNQLLRPDSSKKVNQRLRSTRDATILVELIHHCCSSDCEMDKFIEFEERVRYCDTVM